VIAPEADGRLTFDKLSSVFASGNATRDDAPDHIRIERKVPLAVGLMWQHMCPAQVYEVPEEALTDPGSTVEDSEDQLVDVQVTPSNCVQCGAITAKGGRLTPAEGGEGPNYQVT
jgi:electron-transferring-flavoprotein dehydrogenase